jgi:mannosyltransferase
MSSMAEVDSVPTAEVAPDPPAEAASPPAGGRSGRWRAWLPAVPPALLTLAVAGYRAGDRQLWEDEYATWHASTLGFADFQRLIGHVDLVLAPYYALMHGWIMLAGDSPLALRAPSVLAMAATAGLLVPLGRRLAGTRVGVVAGLLFAAVPTVSRYAQEARPYALAMLLSVASTLLLLRALDRPSWRRFAPYGVAVVLLGLAHLVALSILVAHGLLVRYTARTHERLMVWRWLGQVVVTVAVVGPFALSASGQSQAISWIRLDKPTVRAFPGQLFGSGTAALVVVGLALAGIYLTVRASGPQLSVLTAWALVPPVSTLLTFRLLHLFEYRYLLFTVAAWVLLAAIGVDAIGRGLLPRRRALAGVAGAALAVAGLGWASVPGQLVAREDPVVGYPAYRDAADLIRGQLRPGDAIAYGGQYFRVRRGMTYELRGRLRPRDVFLAESAERLGGYVARECAIPATCLAVDVRRIWLVNTTLSKNPYAELPPLMADLFRDRCTLVSTTHLPHLRVVLLEVQD